MPTTQLQQIKRILSVLDLYSADNQPMTIIKALAGPVWCIYKIKIHTPHNWIYNSNLIIISELQASYNPYEVTY